MTINKKQYTAVAKISKKRVIKDDDTGHVAYAYDDSHIKIESKGYTLRDALSSTEEACENAIKTGAFCSFEIISIVKDTVLLDETKAVH